MIGKLGPRNWRGACDGPRGTEGSGERQPGKAGPALVKLSP